MFTLDTMSEVVMTALAQLDTNCLQMLSVGEEGQIGATAIPTSVAPRVTIGSSVLLGNTVAITWPGLTPWSSKLLANLREEDQVSRYVREESPLTRAGRVAWSCRLENMNDAREEGGWGVIEGQGEVA